MASTMSSSLSVPQSPRTYTANDLKNGVSPFNVPLTPRSISMSQQAVEARRAFFKVQETEKVEVARQLDAFDESLSRLHQRSPRLNMPWRSHMSLAPPTDNYVAVPTHPDTRPSEAQLEEAFKLIDKSGDGSISFTEFMRASRADPAVATLMNTSKVKDAFKQMDRDGSMKVDLEEFKGFVQKMHAPDGGKRIVLSPRQ